MLATAVNFTASHRRGRGGRRGGRVMGGLSELGFWGIRGLAGLGRGEGRHTGVGESPRAGDGFPPPTSRGQALRGNDGVGGVRFIFIATTIQLPSCLRPFDKLRRVGDGFPPPPRIEYGAGSARGHAVTGTTIQLLSRVRPFDKLRRAGDGFPPPRERRFSCPQTFGDPCVTCHSGRRLDRGPS